MRVYWCEHHKLLKLTIHALARTTGRTDEIPGGKLRRELDGKEGPVRDWTLMKLADGRYVGLVFPEGYALDTTPEETRPKLLRNPLTSHYYA